MEENQWEPWKFVLVVTTLWHAFWVIVTNLIMMVIYKAELPFFERYKVNSNPWPWNENKDEWKSILKKSVGLGVFNSFVSLPILLIGSLASTNWEV